MKIEKILLKDKKSDDGKKEICDNLQKPWKEYMEKTKDPNYLRNLLDKMKKDGEKFIEEKGKKNLENELNKSYKAKEAAYMFSAIASVLMPASVPAPIPAYEKPESYLLVVAGVLMFFTMCLVYSKSHEKKDKLRGYL